MRKVLNSPDNVVSLSHATTIVFGFLAWLSHHLKSRAKFFTYGEFKRIWKVLTVSFNLEGDSTRLYAKTVLETVVFPNCDIVLLLTS